MVVLNKSLLAEVCSWGDCFKSSPKMFPFSWIFIASWLENMSEDFFVIFWNMWPRSWSIFVNVPWVLKKKMYYVYRLQSSIFISYWSRQWFRSQSPYLFLHESSQWMLRLSILNGPSRPFNAFLLWILVGLKWGFLFNCPLVCTYLINLWYSFVFPGLSALGTSSVNSMKSNFAFKSHLGDTAFEQRRETQLCWLF